MLHFTIHRQRPGRRIQVGNWEVIALVKRVVGCDDTGVLDQHRFRVIRLLTQNVETGWRMGHRRCTLRSCS